ncbi:MAG TPA: DUF308 domain-containing protein [Gemmatimonadales bacterium]|nr:DUF308 domain-containing protein [Gemmatimonadales bacterium]
MATAAAPILSDIKKAYHRSWWALVIRGLFAVAVGVLILWKPLDSVAVFALVIAYWALFTGFVNIVHAFEVKSFFQQWWVMLLSGLVSVGFGIAALMYYPALSLSFAVVWVAWWLMVTGILGVYGAMQERRLGASWGWTAAAGVVSILASGFALLMPPATLAAIMSLIAAFALVSGVVLLIGAFKLRAAVPL